MVIVVRRGTPRRPNPLDFRKIFSGTDSTFVRNVTHTRTHLHAHTRARTHPRTRLFGKPARKSIYPHAKHTYFTLASRRPLRRGGGGERSGYGRQSICPPRPARPPARHRDGHSAEVTAEWRQGEEGRPRSREAPRSGRRPKSVRMYSLSGKIDRHRRRRENRAVRAIKFTARSLVVRARRRRPCSTTVARNVPHFVQRCSPTAVFRESLIA